MSTRYVVLAVVGFVALVLLSQSMFTVDQTQQAIVLELGRPVRDEALGPGLHFKLPFIQSVVHFDTRVLNYDASPAEVLTKDKKNMVVDNYTKWRISDPLQFYRTVRSIIRAQARLDDIIYSEIRVALGNYTFIDIVRGMRGQITEEVTSKSNALVREYGIEVVDVRIKRTDLPAENARAIYGRMRAERERQAKQYRSEGEEESNKITAAADRERTVLMAEARRQASVLRGVGEAEAIALWADALNRDPEFYAFQRSLEAYEKSFKENSRLVLTPDSPFFKYLR